MIRENKNQFQSRLPGLSQIPLLGDIFGTTNDSTRRTELVVLITPRAVQNPSVARSINEEFCKMESLKPIYIDRDRNIPERRAFSIARGSRST